MSESKHTPGPYHVEGGSIWAEAPDGTNLMIANTRGVLHYVSIGEQKANADLFAAAPELLEALKDMVALVDRRQRGFDATVTIGDLTAQLVGRADSAIDKAEGRS